MGLIVLFQLRFTFIYSTFSKKNFKFSKISESQTDPIYYIYILATQNNSQQKKKKVTQNLFFFFLRLMVDYCDGYILKVLTMLRLLAMWSLIVL